MFLLGCNSIGSSSHCCYDYGVAWKARVQNEGEEGFGAVRVAICFLYHLASSRCFFLLGLHRGSVVCALVLFPCLFLRLADLDLLVVGDVGWLTLLFPFV